MKIRIQGNSIRYRLKQPEVANFEKFGSVTESIQLGINPKDQLRFILQRSANDDVTVHYSNCTTIIGVPSAIVNEWTSTDLVGFDACIDIGNGKTLKLLVEKDFACIDGNEENNMGSYPNPAKVC